ncbi:MAG TPA: hypothetical protein VF746_21820, partial [Longimicrobium sp.]
MATSPADISWRSAAEDSPPPPTGPGEAFERRHGVLYCEDVPIPDLVARWATPLYVYSRGSIRRRYRELDEALAPVPHLIAYS